MVVLIRVDLVVCMTIGSKSDGASEHEESFECCLLTVY